MSQIAVFEMKWRPAFRIYYGRVLPWGAAVGFLSSFWDLERGISLDTLAIAALWTCLFLVLLLGAVGVYTSLRRWRRRSDLNHYLTWLLCVAITVIPVTVALSLLIARDFATKADLSFENGLLSLLAIVVPGVVLGSIAQSIETNTSRAERRIAAGRNRDNINDGAV